MNIFIYFKYAKESCVGDVCVCMFVFASTFVFGLVLDVFS